MATRSTIQGQDRVRYTLGPYGKTFRKNRRFKTRDAALKFKAAIEPVEQATKLGVASQSDIDMWLNKGWLDISDVKTYFPVAAVNISTTTDYNHLEKIHDQHIDRVSSTRRSRASKKSRADRIFKWFRMNVDDLAVADKHDVQAFIDSLDLAQKTKYHFYTELTQILDTAVDENMLKHNVARDVKVKQPKRADSERRPFTEDELDRIWTALESDEDSRKILRGSLEAACMVAWNCGMRNGEVTHMRWDWIDWKNELICIPKASVEPSGETWHPKSGSFRNVGMSDELIGFLNMWKAKQDAGGGYEFVIGGTPNGCDRPFSDDGITQSFATLRTAAKLPDDATFYCFRHLFALDGLKSGKRIDEVKYEMGHASITTTELYLHDLENQKNLNKNKRRRRSS